MSNYVIDIGNGDWKVGEDKTNRVFSFPAVSGNVAGHATIVGGRDKKISNMTFKKDGKDHAIGDMAVKNSMIRNHDITEEKYTSPESTLLCNTALTMLSDQSFDSGNLIIGLPLHKMNQAGAIANHYANKTYGGQIGYFGEYEGQRMVRIDKVRAIEQPYGTLFNLILDSKGEIANKELAYKGVAIYDIGFKTNDGIVFKGLDPIGRLTVHSKNGMVVAYEEIRNEINKQFNGLEIKSFEVAEIIKKGSVKGFNIANVINDSLYNLANNIILELKNRWHDAWEIEQYIFTGGGSVLLRPYLSQAFDSALFMDATSNAEGMLKYAKRLWGRSV